MGTDSETEWQQLTITYPEVVEITVRVGIIRQGETINYQVESRDVTGDVLLSMWSHPGGDSQSFLTDRRRLETQLHAALYAHIDPFL